jgi:hypothetical protein
MRMFSGGAEGSDSYWDDCAKQYGIEDRRHFWHGQKTPRGNVELSEDELEEGWGKILDANQILQRRGIERYKNLLARNYHQVNGADVVLAVGFLDGSIPRGGTCWATTIALMDGIEIYFFDQPQKQWYRIPPNQSIKNEFNWDEAAIPSLRETFAAIGTRDLQESGRSAIREVFERSLDKNKI